MISRDKNSKGFTYTFLELADSINTDIETTKQQDIRDAPPKKCFVCFGKGKRVNKMLA